MMTRRTFLRIAGWCAVPIAAGSLAWRDTLVWVLDRSAARLSAIVRSPEERLRAHFSYLNLDPAGVVQYFADHQRYRPTFSRRLPLAPDVYTNYLLSTDFFRHGADESTIVRYVGFYDPSVTPCNNPLARFDDQRES
jgi:hypothetical protein